MTTDEIVRALRELEAENQCLCMCDECHEDDCLTPLFRSAANLIERLTAENAKAEAERDAAIADLKISSGCTSCKYHCSDITFCCDCNKKQNCKCMSCRLGLMNWQWRGLPGTPEEGE